MTIITLWLAPVAFATLILEELPTYYSDSIADTPLVSLQYPEQVIKSRIPGIQSLINFSIDNE